MSPSGYIIVLLAHYEKDIHSYIHKCHTFAVNKGSVGKPIKILSYPTPLEPWDTLAIDLLKLPTSSEGNQYLLVAIDHFSCYSILVSLKGKTATTVATALIDKVFCPFNTPKTLLSDNGTEFNNSILSEMCKQFDIKKINIVAYHPASNGLVERQNRKILAGSNSDAWHIWMPQVAASLNSSLHASIGDTPHFVMFGQDKRLPYSLLLTKEEPIYNYDDYVRVRVSDFQKTYKRVTDNIAMSREKWNAQQHRMAGSKVIAIGDVVHHSIKEVTTKLDPRFEGPYRVIGIDHGNKVKIRHLTDYNTKIVHVDHLKRVSRSMDDGEELPSPEPPSTPEQALPSTSLEYRKKSKSSKTLSNA